MRGMIVITIQWFKKKPFLTPLKTPTELKKAIFCQPWLFGVTDFAKKRVNYNKFEIATKLPIWQIAKLQIEPNKNLLLKNLEGSIFAWLSVDWLVGCLFGTVVTVLMLLWALKMLKLSKLWWMMGDGWWMMDDRWWMTDDGWCMKDDGWWIVGI